MDDMFDLAKFDEYKEDNRREVKAAEGGLPQSLWDTYSAMANTYGGVIICGVRERKDGTWFTTGMKNAEKLKKNLWDQANDQKKVSVNLLTESDIKVYEVDGDVILVIPVPMADRETKPVYINGDLFRGTFKRTNEGDYHCTEREVKAMIRDQATASPDMKVLEDEEISDFDAESVRAYRLRYEGRHANAAWTKLPDDRFLVQIGAASDKTKDGRIHPTAAGLLMFGQEYRITPQFPEYFLDYREKLNPDIRWTDRVQSQSGDFSGNVFDFFSMVYPKITADFKKPFMTEGAYRVEETPKHLAVREALANCLVNADYFQSWSVVIERYPDRIVMSNPGTIILGKKQMLRGGISEPRNKNLFKMFNLLGIGEHAGSGVPDIFDVWRTEGLEEPVVEEQFGVETPDRTTLILPLGKKEPDVSQLSQEKSQEKSRETKADEIANRREAVYELIRNTPGITTPALAKALAITDRKVRTVLEQLKQSGRIRFEGTGRGGRWIINE
ncbi:MAG: putative DNA binding domain-containing protein [Clostridia bacterium]|nr:putative DNA binding domain-containing protein [Clostridia bacterium]